MLVSVAGCQSAHASAHHRFHDQWRIAGPTRNSPQATLVAARVRQ
jgi:hypothetical protein